MRQLISLLLYLGFALPALAQPVRVGAMLHLTGDLAMQGAAFREGIEVARDEINAGGGIDGRPLEVIFEDTQLRPSVVDTVSRKLLSQYEVVAALITTSAETKAAGTLFERSRVPLICLWDSSPEMEAMGDFVFGIGTWTPSTGERAARFAFESLKTRRAAVIVNQDEWSLSAGDEFGRSFETFGGSVIFREAFPPAEVDFRSVFAKLKSAAPEVLYAPIGFQTASFFRQLREAGLEIPVIESDNLNDEIISAGEGALEGVYQTQSADPEGEQTARFSDSYRSRFGREPKLLLYSAWGYDGLQLLAHAMRRGAVDASRIKDELYRIQEFSGASGVISMSAAGSSRVAVKVYQVRQGKLRSVE